MIFSFSSFLISLILSTILIFIFYLLLTVEKNYTFFRVDFLVVLVISIILRLLIPLEFPFTITILSEHFMTFIVDFLNLTILGYKIATLLEVIWLIGSLISLFFYVKNFIKTEKMYQNLYQSSKKSNLSDYIEQKNIKNYKVLISDQIKIPVVLSYHHTIFIPNTVTENEELEHILLHEAYHIKCKDFYVKQIANIFIIVYWWFFPIYIFKKMLNLFLEIKVDAKVTKNLDSSSYFDYIQTVIQFQKKVMLETHSFPTCYSSHLIAETNELFTYRIKYFLEGSLKRKSNIFLLLFSFSIPFLSNIIIFEPAYYSSPLLEGTSDIPTAEEGYILHTLDGDYKLILNGTPIDISDPFHEIFKNLEIIEEKDK